MKQVLRSRGGDITVRDVPPPACPPGGVLVQNLFSVISSGTERSATAQARKSLLARSRERPDLAGQVVARARKDGIRTTRASVQRKLSEEKPVGYSSVGRVIEVGFAVREFKPGDVVACAGGGYASHAQFIAVPANLCAKVPETVDLGSAALTTIAAIALHGVRLADVRVGEAVAVIGCGLVGQLTCRLLRAGGASTFAVDIDPARVRQAVAGGADTGVSNEAAVDVVMHATRDIGADGVIVTAAASTSAPLVLGARLARDRASLVLVGEVPIELPRKDFFDKELQFRISRSYGPGRYDAEYEERGLDYPVGYVRWTEKRNMECVLDLQARGLVVLEDLVRDVMPVEEASLAYERLLEEGDERPQGALVLAYGDSKPVERRNPTPASGSAAAISDRQIRIGLIGPGGFASRILVPAFNEAGAALEVVGGGSGPSAEAATRQLGFARAAASEGAVIDDQAVDAVAICTRHATHPELTVRALHAGKHVFCEKPLALTSRDLSRVLEAAAESGGVLAVGFNRRFSPLLRQLRDFLGETPSAKTASYRVSAGHIPLEHWTHDLAQGGGRALGEVCHFVDSLVFLIGAQVTEVHAVGHGMAQAPVQAQDNLAISLTFEDGSIGSILYVAQGSPRVPKERLEIFAGTRTAVLDDFQSLKTYSANAEDTRKLRSGDKGHEAEVRAFLDGIRKGTHPVPLDEVQNVSAATLAIVDSLRLGLPIAVGGAPNEK